MDFPSGWDRIARYVERRSRPILILILGGALVLAALRIVDYAFLPPDDALRHAATAVSGRSYAEVLVLDEGVPAIDSTPGWHSVLRAVLHLPGMDKYGLVTFAIFLLFVAYTTSGLFVLARPEAWASVVLLAVVLEPSYAVRWALGRPFLLTGMATVVFALTWSRLVRDPRDRGALLACLSAAALTTWLHSTWFLLLAVPGTALLTREWKAVRALWGAVLAGVVLGAILTLQPLAHLTYPLIHTWKTMGTTPGVFRVTELQPFGGAASWVLVGGLLILARFSIPELKDFRLRHPAFLTAAATWVLGFTASRFWSDIGLPALMAGTALAVQQVLEGRVPRRSLERWLLTGAVAASLFLAVGANHGRRWEATPLRRALYFTEHPDEVADWLPAPGGVLYSSDMGVFFSLFFTFPDGGWKYILGPEQGIMPREDRDVLHDIADRRNWDAYLPWVAKLRPEDRLFLVIPPGVDPPEWEGVEIIDVPRSYSIVRTARGGGAAAAGGNTGAAGGGASVPEDSIPEPDPGTGWGPGPPAGPAPPGDR